MIVGPLLLAALQTQGPQLHVIELDPAKPKSVHEIRSAPALSTTISFPESWAVAPVCGDCVFGDAELKGQLWRLDLIPETNTIIVKPTRLPGADVPASAFLTNVDVTLKSGIAVTMFVKLVLPEQAFARVEFKLPASATGDAVLKREREAMEKQFGARVKAATEETLVDAFMGPMKCRDTWGGPRQSDRMFVRILQICRNRSFIFVNFEVENAGRPDLQLLGATITDADDSSSDVVRFAKKTLKFDERTAAVLLLPIEDPSLPNSSYNLVVMEDGGLERAVTLKGLSF